MRRMRGVWGRGVAGGLIWAFGFRMGRVGRWLCEFFVDVCEGMGRGWRGEGEKEKGRWCEGLQLIVTGRIFG